MLFSRIVGSFALVAAIGASAIQVSAASQSRSDVSSLIKKACTEQSSCLAAVKAQLAMAKCSVNPSADVTLAQGLADAVVAIAKTNAGLATQLATIVASNGAACVQVAFGAVLDGTGTASTGIPSAGSAG